jgi:hypothetical protein
MFGRKTLTRKRKLSLLDMSTRTRGFILDSQISDGHEVCALLGCSTISDEGAAHEEYESDMRVERISHLIPLLYAYAKTLAEGTNMRQLQSLPDSLSDIPKEVWEQTAKMMEEFAFSALVGAVSQLIDLELITLPKDKR